jgi:predicted nucleic acid-binding protein
VAHYLDSSALVKLVVEESESPALDMWLRDAGGFRVSSDLARVELLRAIGRYAPERFADTDLVVKGIVFVNVDRSVLDAASLLKPALLRTLDAIHLATALEFGNDLRGIVTYDSRLADAARQHGFRVVAPA